MQEISSVTCVIALALFDILKDVHNSTYNHEPSPTTDSQSKLLSFVHKCPSFEIERITEKCSTKIM